MHRHLTGLPAWVGPLTCMQCGRVGCLRVEDPPTAVVRCCCCGWQGPLVDAEQRTLEDAVRDLGGVLPEEIRPRRSPPGD